MGQHKDEMTWGLEGTEKEQQGDGVAPGQGGIKGWGHMGVTQGMEGTGMGDVGVTKKLEGTG